MTSIHESFMKKCLDVAHAAARAGDEPFGALLVADGQILLEGKNTVVTSGDRTGHAELNLARAAAALDPAIVARSTLYASTEPCAMCAGAIYWCGIPEVVYGCPAEALGALTGGSLVIPCRRIFDLGKHAVRIIGPVLESEAIEVHRDHLDRYNPPKGETR